MAAADVGQTRTFGLIGHGGDGKTTLADALLLRCGVTTRLGSVAEMLTPLNLSGATPVGSVPKEEDPLVAEAAGPAAPEPECVRPERVRTRRMACRRRGCCR